MAYQCREVDVSFLDNAPGVMNFEVELEAPAARVFAILEDDQAWPKWFSEIEEVIWTSPKPFGVGTTRTVRLTTVTVYEKFLIWEPGKRFAFYFTSQSRKLTRAFAEDYRVEDLPGGRSKLFWRVCYEPAFPFNLIGPIFRWVYTRMFEKACKGLAGYVKANA